MPENNNPQVLYQKSDLILKIQVVDNGRRKLFKAEVNMMDKVKVAKIFNLLRLKFNVTIPQDLKEEVSGWDKLALG